MLRKKLDPAEYKCPDLELIFLNYIFDAFEELYKKPKVDEDEYERVNPEEKGEI